ncbi:MAG: STAS domain-containing protein [Ruminococcus sp.]|nr:STAS domain-containing protein [Ruminococcus sp.]
MTIKTNKEGSVLTVAIEGKLDTRTAPELEEMLKDSLDGITKLVLDLKELVYISSAGLRVVVTAEQAMEKQGEMVIRNVNEDVMNIFEVTGFVDALNIE